MTTKTKATIDIVATIANIICVVKYGLIADPTFGNAAIAIFFLIMAGVATINATQGIATLIRQDSSNG